MSGMTRPPTRVSADEFQALFRSLSEWRRWGKDDERGALHHLTRERVATAAGLVRDGITVTLSLPVATERAPSNPVPAEHRMTMLFDTDIGSGAERFAKDYIGVDYHNDGHTHIDAFCHVAYEGALYNGRPQDTVTSAGAAADAIEVLKDGLVGRGVLLDIPRVRGVAWLEPGEHIFRDDLEAAEREQGVRLGAGDILLVRTGHVRRLRELGPWDTASAKAGLHPTAMPLIAERHGRRGFPDPRPGPERDGGPPTGLPSVRGSAGGVRADGAVGLLLRRRAASHPSRDGLADQPHSDPLDTSRLCPAALERDGHAAVAAHRGNERRSPAGSDWTTITAPLRDDAPSKTESWRNTQDRGARPRTRVGWGTPCQGRAPDASSRTGDPASADFTPMG